MIPINRTSLVFVIICFLLATPLSFSQNKEIIYLSADNIDYDYKQKIVKYNGNVSAKQGLTTLNADQMIVTYNKKNKIKEIKANGNLAKYETRVNDDQDLLKALAKTIIYYPLDGKVKLQDEARVEYNQSVFTGPYIDYDMNKKLISSRYKLNNQCKIVLEPIKQLELNEK